ncbi:MAG: SRPBCC domain-containing protein [Planctomycetaceae bacterium]
MATRQHVREETFPVSAERLFAILHTPSAIRGWWGAAQAVVLAETGGTWAATWGRDEDDPDSVTVAAIREFDPPRRMVLSDYRYYSKDGPLPFEVRFVTEFAVAPTADGAALRVTQEGFPASGEADDYYALCERGWRDTFAGIRRYLASPDG